MNEVFNIKRLANVLRYDFNLLCERFLKSMLPTIMIIYVILLVVANILSWSGSLEGFRWMSILFIWTVSCFAAPFRMYYSVTHKTEGLIFATMPASMFEKYVSMLFYSILVMPLLSVSALFLTDTLIASVSGILNLKTQGFLSPDYIGYLMTDYQMLFSLLLIISTSICGNALFKKNKILKTLLSVLLINIVMAMAMLFVLGTGVNAVIGISGMNFAGGEYITYTVTNSCRAWVWLYASLPLLLLVISYFKLKNCKY